MIVSLTLYCKVSNIIIYIARIEKRKHIIQFSIHCYTDYFKVIFIFALFDKINFKCIFRNFFIKRTFLQLTTDFRQIADGMNYKLYSTTFHRR